MPISKKNKSPNLLKENKLELEFMSDSVPKAPRKRLFLGLVAGTAFSLCLLGLVGWVIPYVGFGNIHKSVPIISIILLSILILSISWATLGLIIQIFTGKELWGIKRLHGITIRCFLPLMEILGRIIGFSQDEVRRSFIKVNNELALKYKNSLKAEEILILVPHCIQTTKCTIRISHNIYECKQCGACPIADLIEINKKYSCPLGIATGGSIARLIVGKYKPKFIIAVACERDLASGIQDTYPLPTFGILNSRPDGPCINTVVSSSLIEAALNYFTKSNNDK